MKTGISQRYAEGDVTERQIGVVPLEFWTDHAKVAGSDELTPIDWARWARIGSNGATTEDKVERVKKHNPIIWQALQKPYEAWKAGQDEPIDGTPLEAWPGVTRGQVAHFKLLNIRTVEELAGVNDATMDRLGLGARALVARAKDFVANKNSGVTALAAQKAELEERLLSMMSRVEELEARLMKRAKKEKDEDG